MADNTEKRFNNTVRAIVKVKDIKATAGDSKLVIASIMKKGGFADVTFFAPAEQAAKIAAGDYARMMGYLAPRVVDANGKTIPAEQLKGYEGERYDDYVINALAVSKLEERPENQSVTVELVGNVLKGDSLRDINGGVRGRILVSEEGREETRAFSFAAFSKNADEIKAHVGAAEGKAAFTRLTCAISTREVKIEGKEYPLRVNQLAVDSWSDMKKKAEA